MFFILDNIAVFFGGTSPEREISVITGVLTLNCIDKNKFNPIPIYIHDNKKFYTGEKLFNLDFFKSINIKNITECTFLAGDSNLYLLKKNKLKKTFEIGASINCLHGKNGEDGSMFGFMQTHSIPFLSAGIFAESLSMDKDFTKLILKSLEIPHVESVRIKREHFFAKSEAVLKYVNDKLGFPVIVKPARLGSSIGIEKASTAEMLFSALSNAFNYDDKVICEKYLTNARDLNCAVYGINGKIFISKVVEAVTFNDILTFDDKYGKAKNSLLSGCESTALELNEEVIKKVQSYSEKVYRRCDFNSIVRFDFLLCNGEIYLNEINAVPGSLAYYLFCEKTADFSVLLEKLILDCKENFRKSKNLLASFKSNVLNGDWSGIKK